MDKIKFLMTDTGAQTTQLCRQALEAKGIDVKGLYLHKLVDHRFS